MMGKDYSVVVLGAGGVGKTSMVVQFIHGFFTHEYNPTIEDCYRHIVQLPDGYYHTVEILDTAGTHQFPAMRELSIRSGQAFVLVYSIDCEESFHEAIRLGDLVVSIKGEDQVPMVLVGNKADLNDHREVSVDFASKFSMEALNCPHLETSAKYNLNINKLFMELLSEARNIVVKVDKSKRRKAVKNTLKVPTRIGLSLKRHSADGGGRTEPVTIPPDTKCIIL